MNRLAPYLEFALKAFARSAVYRFEVFTGIASVLVRIYLLKSVWNALYAQNAAPADLPLHAIVTYSVVALLMSLVLEVDGTRVIQTRLREGSIATDLMKPISLPLFFFSDGLGRTAFEALSVVPSLALALTFVRVDVPPLAVLAAFAVAFAFGYVVNFLINFILNATAFWTLEIQALQASVRWMSDLLSGQLLPLSLFPGELGTIVQASPFASIYSIPLRIYVGQLPPSAWPAALGSQLGWMACFALAAFAVWRAAERRVVVQGG